MDEWNISQEFRLKNIDETRNYLIEEINQNKLVSKKYKKVCRTLNYVEHFLILGSRTTGYISISAFASLVGIPIGFTSSEIGWKICSTTAATKNYKSVIKKKGKINDKIVLLAKSKLYGVEVLIFTTLIDLVVSHDEFGLINNVLKERNKMKEAAKNLNTKSSLVYLWNNAIILLFDVQKKYRK